MHKLWIQDLVVTNQSGIARGFYTEADLADLHSWMLSRFASQIFLDDIYYCPFHPTDGIGDLVTLDRKPKPGMICKAILDHSINPLRSILIGDSPTDIFAAQAAQVSTTILLSTSSMSIVTLAITFQISASYPYYSKSGNLDFPLIALVSSEIKVCLILISCCYE